MVRSTPAVFHNWKAKLAALALAVVIWLVIRQNIRNNQGAPPPPATPPAQEGNPH